MKIETILNAFEIARARTDWLSYTGIATDKDYRQRLAFRARILKMFEEKDKENEQLVVLSEELVKKKDARIAELKAENQAMEYLLNEGENIGVE